MSEMAEIPHGDPMRDAWEQYKRTDDYANTRRWALHEQHVDGSLWASFMAGFKENSTRLQRAEELLREAKPVVAHMSFDKKLFNRIDAFLGEQS